MTKGQGAETAVKGRLPEERSRYTRGQEATAQPQGRGQNGHRSLADIENERQTFMFNGIDYEYFYLAMPLLRNSFWLNKDRNSPGIQP